MSDSARTTQQAAEDLTAAVEDTTEPQTVPVNMYETSDAVVIVAALPAVMPDDVLVEVTPGQVTIRSTMRTAAPKDYLLNEWTYGPYERTVELPEGFGRGVNASLANGQLAVRVLRGAPEGDDVTVVVPSSPSRTNEP